MNLETLKIEPAPDFSRIEKMLSRKSIPDKAPCMELRSDLEEKIMGGKIKKQDFKNEIDYSVKLHIEYQYRLGYDFAGIRSDFNFPQKKSRISEGEKGKAEIVQSGDSLVSNREEFEKYPWPDMSKIDYSPMEKAKKILPEGMKLLPRVTGGVFENAMLLVGFEQICYYSVENPEFLRDVFKAIGERVEQIVKNYASMDIVGAIAVGDDLGFKTQTMLSPKMIKEYIFPWHKKIVKAAHAYNKPIILHSCGNLREIYEGIIDCGWDAKHSFEDEILPIWEFKKQYGNRISCIGGFDMNKICLYSEEEIRKHTRYLIDTCATGGGFALGTGNSASSYVPPENLLTMLEEAWLYGKYR